MRLGDHEVVRLIARGGMGAIHEVRHAVTGVRYAAKTVLATDDMRARERFRREAELLARCDRHPGIVKVHSFGDAPDGGLYMILDLVEGEDLDAILRREGRLEPRRAATIARDVARALGAAHALGVVHRDVKPSNILIDKEGRALLTDFGLASARDVERLTRSGMFVGTVQYGSPEQAFAEAAVPASDVFSLGCVLFHLLAGTPPIVVETAMEHLRILTSPGPVGDVRVLAPETPDPLAAIVSAALEKEPEARPRDGTELAGLLDAFLAGQARPAPRAPGRHAALAAGAVLVAAVAALVALGSAGPGEDERARLAIEALGEVARASVGASDTTALLAASAAVELGAAVRVPVPAETALAGAHGALARGAPALAASLATAALADASSPRREEALLVRANARAHSDDRAAALSDVAALRSPAARRLRARLLLDGRCFEELATGPEETEVFASAARALALAVTGRRRPESARPELRQHRELLAVLDEHEGLAAIAPVVSRAANWSAFVTEALSHGAVHLAALSKAARHLDTAADADRWIDRAGILAALDRALAVVERAPISFAPASVTTADLPAHWDSVESMGRALEAVALKLAAHEPLDALSHRIRMLRILDVLERGERPADATRLRFLDEALERCPPALVGRLRLALAFKRELSVLRGDAQPETLLDFVEETAPLIDRAARTWDDQNLRVALEILAANLALRAVTDLEGAPRGRAIERARKHVAEGLALDPAPAQRHGRARLSVLLSLTTGDVAAAAREAAAFAPHHRTPADEFVRGEALRLSGDQAGARARFSAAAAQALDVGGAWVALDIELATVLLDQERGDPDARARLAKAWARRGGRVRPLPWIRRAVRELLGE